MFDSKIASENNKPRNSEAFTVINSIYVKCVGQTSADICLYFYTTYVKWYPSRLKLQVVQDYISGNYSLYVLC